MSSSQDSLFPSARPTRRRALGLIASTGLALPTAARGQSIDWPAKTVRVVSPSTGGITDTHARIVFEALSDRLGHASTSTASRARRAESRRRSPRARRPTATRSCS